jgi:hypothetical protein
MCSDKNGLTENKATPFAFVRPPRLCGSHRGHIREFLILPLSFP